MRGVAFHQINGFLCLNGEEFIIVPKQVGWSLDLRRGDRDRARQLLGRRIFIEGHRFEPNLIRVQLMREPINPKL